MKSNRCPETESETLWINEKKHNGFSHSKGLMKLYEKIYAESHSFILIVKNMAFWKTSKIPVVISCFCIRKRHYSMHEKCSYTEHAFLSETRFIHNNILAISATNLFLAHKQQGWGSGITCILKNRTVFTRIVTVIFSTVYGSEILINSTTL